MQKIPKIIYILLAVLIAIGGLTLSQAQRVRAIEPGVYEVDGNPSCADLNADSFFDNITSDYGFKIDAQPVGSDLLFTFINGTQNGYPTTLTGGAPSDPANSVTINSDGVFFDWTSTIGMDAVIVKARDANTYIYVPEVYGGSDLYPPDEKDISHIEFCYDYWLTATKTANASYTRTIDWDITKAADADYSGFIGDPAIKHDYSVSVEKLTSDADFMVSGEIVVNNPTPFSVNFTVTDVVGDTPAAVSCPTYNLAPGASVTCTYDAALDGAVDGVNTATITADNGLESITASAPYAFGDPTLVGLETIHVSDSYMGALGSTSESSTFFYSKDFTCPTDLSLYTNGVYVAEADVNTATIDELQESDIATVNLTCYAPGVSKTAKAEYAKEYTWDIVKEYDGTYKKFIGDAPTTHDYLVSVDQGFTETGYAVSGDITVNNPNPDAAMTVAVTDLVDGIPAVLECGGTLVVPAGGSAACGYSADLPAKEDGANTATVSFNGLEFTASADYTFGEATSVVGDAVIHVTDSNGQVWEASGDAEWAYTQDFSCPTDPALYVDGFYSFTHKNTARITETGASDDALVTVKCYAPKVSKDADTEWFKKIDWDITKSVDPDTLIGFAGESFTAGYDVFVDQTITPSGYRAYGNIYVTNPADAPGPMTVSVADVLNGVAATLDCDGSLTVAAGATAFCGYTVDLPDAKTRLNSATVTFNQIDFLATADVIFGNPIVVGFPAINVTDSVVGDLGKAGGDFTFEYSREFSCSSNPADYTDGFYKAEYENIATIVETGQFDKATVTVKCYAPGVSKTAEGSIDKTFDWTILKTATPPTGGQPGDTVDWTWTVSVDYTTTLGNPTVSGVITVANPHPSQPLTVTLSDVLDDGTAVSLDCGGSLTVPAASSATCTYSAAATPKATLNTVTASFNGIDFSAVQPITWTVNPVNGTAHVTDQMIGLDEEVSKPTTWTATGEHTCSTLKADYDETGMYNVKLTNTATITWGDRSASSTAQTAYACKAGFMDVTKTTNGAVSPARDWQFALYTGGFDGSLVASASTLDDTDGVLFDELALRPLTQYTVCELGVPAGWTSSWMIDLETDELGIAPIAPYNPDDPENLGNLCVDFYPSLIVDGKIGKRTTVHFTVNNMLADGDPRTPGYWKNWNTCTGGNQSATSQDNGGWAEGFWLLDDVLNPAIGGGVTWDDLLEDEFVFPIDSCELGVSILNTRDFDTGRQRASDPAYNLAKHLLAAQANLIAGACSPDPATGIELGEVILQAETLLDEIDFDGIGPGIDRRADPDRADLALTLAHILNEYNNGRYCGSTYAGP